eukprot:CAMPEP_0182420944 /NCGR_PEP_ID=MMETSP1167-20130531/6070_1 /TAXON_ID=2988 /ORGANISM="Mallomonas Sp, Strain CCMP3275" /LENGTH=371 /DNA_ID=CAMNT_0024597547 /DNA_START=67 /DNA_END=1179 /DNA_ORIENTATION=+
METMDEVEIDLTDLPQDIDKLQLLVSDLARRLQNALHMVEAQKQLVINSTSTCDKLRSRVSLLSNKLRLEVARNETYHKQKIKNEESLRYDKLKKSAGAMHEELRMALLDNSMKFSTKKEPHKITALRKKLETIESRQESQKQYLQQISTEQQMVEQLANDCQHGRLEKAHNLIKRGTNVNDVDSAGFLPIHYAAAGGFDSVVRMLLEYGADVSSYLSGYSPLCVAAQNGHVNVIRLLMEFGADVEEKDKGGCPPIVSAASQCHTDCVEALINYGADPNATDLNENTALHVLARQDKPGPVADLLLSRGADESLQNKQGYTPLQLALSIMNTPGIAALNRSRINDSGLASEFMDDRLEFNDYNISYNPKSI